MNAKARLDRYHRRYRIVIFCHGLLVGLLLACAGVDSLRTLSYFLLILLSLFPVKLGGDDTPEGEFFNHQDLRTGSQRKRIWSASFDS